MELERKDSRHELAKTASALFGPDPFSVSEKIARTPEPVIEPEAVPIVAPPPPPKIDQVTPSPAPVNFYQISREQLPCTRKILTPLISGTRGLIFLTRALDM